MRRAIEDGVVSREDVFVTSKVSPGSYADPAPSIDASLARLGLDYLDLMLIHQPGSDDAGVYRAMEGALAAGKLRSIGVSNYYTPAALDEVLAYASVPPAVVQNENHLYYQNAGFQAYAADACGAVVESWYPLGGRAHVAELLADETVAAISAGRGATPAQVILRWHVQSGYVAIPGSSDAAHIAENLAALDVEFGAGDMAAIAALDRQRRFAGW